MRWTIFHLNLALVYSIFHGKISDMYMPGVYRLWITSIFLHTHHTLIVLIDQIVFYPITLYTHKHHEPCIVWDIFAHSYQLGFCGASHVYLLLRSFYVHYSIPHWYCTPCIFSHIIMHIIHCIYPHVQVRECFCTNNSLIFYCIFHVCETSI